MSRSSETRNLNRFFRVMKRTFRGWEGEIDIQESEDGETLKGLRIIIGAWTPEETEDRVVDILRDTVEHYAALPHHLAKTAKDAIEQIHKIREE